MTHTLFANEQPQYEVLNAEVHSGEKVSIEIMVSRPLTREEISTIARTIYKIFRGSLYKRVFIDWYLPGMKTGAGVWATTHFDPYLRINIMSWMLEHNPPAQRIHAE